MFFNPGPQDPLPCMFSMFPSSNTPDSNELLLIRPLQSLMTSWSFESGVVEEGNMENMQGRGSRGPGLKNPDLRDYGQTRSCLSDKSVSLNQISHRGNKRTHLVNKKTAAHPNIVHSAQSCHALLLTPNNKNNKLRCNASRMFNKLWTNSSAHHSDNQ